MTEQEKQIRLTSAEIAPLWAQYMNDSASACILSYFLEKAEDQEIKPVIEHGLELTKSHIQKTTSFFTDEKYAIPQGFKIEEDVVLTAPRLYSDSIVLQFIYQMARGGLTTYSAAVSLAVRADLTEYFIECLSETMQLYKMSKDLLLSKGLFNRSPYLPNMTEVELVKKQEFMWDIIRDKRPLNAPEIANLYADYQRNAQGSAILTGFAQVAQAKEVKKYFIRGIEIAQKQLKLFGGKLEESKLPVPTTWTSEVTESTANTFSDKLMMFFTTTLTSLSIGYYGIGIATSPRIDLGVLYNRLSAEVQLFAEDGANIMIKNKWLEQPPMASDRDDLISKK
ncbi:DUF3231 family protein [Neobacillus vireti]|uniref:DUF3231 family protein n=1 Tax=Neobacillus vireti TaxID=220686 RepID=UPI002FFDAC3B